MIKSGFPDNGKCVQKKIGHWGKMCNFLQTTHHVCKGFELWQRRIIYGYGIENDPRLNSLAR